MDFQENECGKALEIYLLGADFAGANKVDFEDLDKDMLLKYKVLIIYKKHTQMDPSIMPH